MSAIFVSYRRRDAQGWAGRLGTDLAEAFGDVARFLDFNPSPLVPIFSSRSNAPSQGPVRCWC